MDTPNNNQLIEQEQQEMLQRMQQSDNIICTNVQRLQFTHKKDSDQAYMAWLSRSMPNKIRDVSAEDVMWKQTYSFNAATCTPDILKRGGNGVAPPQANKAYGISQHDKRIAAQDLKLYNNLTRRV